MKIHYLFNLILALTNMFYVKKYLHIYQLKSYRNIRYFRYFKNKKTLFLLLCLILFFVEIFFTNILFYIITNTILFIINLFYTKKLIKSSKTPLKFTGKLSRLYIISIFTLLTLCYYQYSFPIIIVSAFLCPIFANTINIYDKIKNKIFINKAQKKLKHSYTQVIAITGSNGKTTVKNILLEMLSTEHKVQATPASFNTPIGIAKFINENLKKDTEFLILEYGARQKNDIKKLCKLFGADYGIVTTIAPQHIETFKSIENIFYAKKQLPIYLDNKPCIFNIDNLYCKRLAEEKNTNKICVSINKETDVYAKNLKIIENFMQFNLILNKKVYKLKTNLLGRHNVLNIGLASALANLIGVKDENIVFAIKKLQPIEHRLQLIKKHINIIDDSYNCSPASAKEALWVLKNFAGKKMVVTPGIIECGKEKFNINFNLGKQLAFCDFCLIIGEENKTAILEGIQTEMNTKKLKPEIMFSKTLEEAKHYFSKLNTGNTLLLLNDLPDDYK